MTIEEAAAPVPPGPKLLYELAIRAFEMAPGAPPHVVVEAPVDQVSVCLKLLSEALSALAAHVAQQAARGVQPATEAQIPPVPGCATPLRGGQRRGRC